MYIPVHAGLDVDPEKFFLRQLQIDNVGFGIGIAYDDGTSDFPIVASVNISKAPHTENRTYALPGAGAFDQSIGRIAIGPLNEIEMRPNGLYLFDPINGRLDTDVIRPMIEGVTSITVVNGGERSPKLVGDIEFIAGTNYRIVPVLAEGEDPQIIFNAIEGEGLTEECICEDEVTAQCVRTINGIPPAANANFTFIGNDCLEITPITNGVELADVCSAPCCGCEELEAVNSQITRFGDGVVTLEGFVNRLGAEVDDEHERTG
jgi:hypothetical protein